MQMIANAPCNAVFSYPIRRNEFRYITRDLRRCIANRMLGVNVWIEGQWEKENGHCCDVQIKFLLHYICIIIMRYWTIYWTRCVRSINSRDSWNSSSSTPVCFCIRDAPSPRWSRISWTSIHHWTRSICRYSWLSRARRFTMKLLTRSRNSSRNIWGRSRERRMAQTCLFTRYEK